LTAAEQREKAERRARREEAERQQTELQRVEHRKAAAAAAVTRQQRESRPQQGQSRGLPQQNRNQLNRRPGQANGGSGLAKSPGGPTGGSVFRKIEHKDEQPPRNIQQKWTADQLRKGGNQPTRKAIRDANNRERENLFGQPSKTPAKVAMPGLLKALESAPKEEPKVAGWGIGSVVRKSTEYELDPEFARESMPPVDYGREDISQPKLEPVATFGMGAGAKSRAQRPAAAFGLDANAVSEPNKPARSSESIHDILNVDPRSVSPPSSMASRPDYEREAQQPPQPPPTRARIINRNEYRFTPSQDDSGGQDNWQNLRRRQSDSPPPSSTEKSTAPMSEHDDSWIDRRFAEYQQERANMTIRTPPRAPQMTQRRKPRREFEPFAEDDVSHRTCGRCGEKGHVARQCALNYKQSKCTACGQTGHMARYCPAAGTPRSNASWNPAPTYQRANQGDSRDDVFDPRQEMMNRMKSKAAAQEPAEEDMDPSERVRKARMQKFAARETEGEDEEPTERVLRSRKFRDDEPKKEKASRRGRRDDDDDYDRGERRSRRDRDFEDDEEGGRRSARKANKKEAKGAERKAQRAVERAVQQAEQKNQIKLPEFISVQNLAQALGVRYEQFVTRLEDLGYDDIFPGKIFNTEVSGMIAMEYEMEPVFDSSIREEEERDLKARPAVDEQDKELLPTRPPVVTIMGHVDHGKTTILDYLRKSSVAAGEAGGITQHIGAFSVPLTASGKTVTFLDTPGHAAFLAMRQRGANVTDIVILVVAADDSVKPQTLEAIKHAKGANVPMLVAINKCDKESADVQRVKQDLARHGVEIEDFGGDTQVVEVSGKTGLGMEKLEEAAVTLSEILDHRADTDGAVEGWVLEATTKKAGRVATVLVRRGTLRQGAVIVAGKTWARVRSLHNEAGVAITKAGPGMPVEVDGWRDQPAAGDEVLQAPNEQKATSVVEYRLEVVEREKTAEDMEVINEARRLQAEKREQEKIAAQQAKQRQNTENGASAEAEDTQSQPTATTGGRIEIPFLIKADVSGSAEAVEAYIMSVSSPMVAPRILSSSVGAVHESDIELAATTQGHIIAFNLPSDEGIKAMAAGKGVRVLENNIIYRVLDDVKSVLEEKLPPIITQRVLGEAEIGAAFEIGVGGRKKVKIAGCKIRNGVIGNGTRVRVMRGEEKVYDGTIASLKNVKKDVQEMRKGSECGMGFDGWEAFEVGDQIQTYEERSEKRTL
jgi:translation initiation factor IF-2